MSTLTLSAIMARVGLYAAPKTPPVTPEPRHQRRIAVKELQERLFPLTFCSLNHAPCVALAIGVDREIAERYRDVPTRTRRTFREYTRNPAYRRLRVADAPRMAVGGSVVGHVTEKEAQHVAKRLQKMLRTGASAGYQP